MPLACIAFALLDDARTGYNGDDTILAHER